MTHADANHHVEAVHYLERCIQVSLPSESHLRKAYALLVSSLSQLSRSAEADLRCSDGLEHFPHDKELLFRKAMLLHGAGRLDDAEATYLRVLNEHEDRHFSSIDVELSTLKACHNLAIVYEDQGRLDVAESLWRSIQAEHPGYFLAYLRLADLLIGRHALNEVRRLITDLEEDSSRRRVARLLTSRLAEAEQEPQMAIAQLQLMLNDDSTDVVAHQERCRLLFHHGTNEEAVSALGQLIALCPNDGAAHHNLAMVLERGEQLGLAKHHFQESLRIRPHSSTTAERLRHVTRALDRDRSHRHVTS